MFAVGRYPTLCSCGRRCISGLPPSWAACQSRLPFLSRPGPERASKGVVGGEGEHSRKRQRQNRVDAGVAEHGDGGPPQRAGAGPLAEPAVVRALRRARRLPPPAPALPVDRPEAHHVRQNRAELHDEDPQVVQPEPVALVLLRDPAL